MREYQQISYEERLKIAELKQSGCSNNQIAKSLCRDHSTIGRELRRNEAPPGQYWPDTAELLCRQRTARQCRLSRDEELRNFVIDKICSFGWSPEQVAGYLKYGQSELPSVCHETIYTWIYSPEGKIYQLYKNVARHKRKRGLRKAKAAGVSRIPQRRSIAERPEGAKSEFGHWEGDLMSYQKNSQHMVVLREKRSGFVLSARLKQKTAQITGEEIMALLTKFGGHALKTLTFDNGGEFAGHHLVAEKTGVETYFCDPYASWQKGGVENSNGRLRRDLPRSTDIWKLDQEDFDEIIDNHNLTPRKMLNWHTPLEVFYENLHAVALRS